MAISSKKVTVSLILKLAVVAAAAAGVALSARASSETFMGGGAVFINKKEQASLLRYIRDHYL